MDFFKKQMLTCFLSFFSVGVIYAAPPQAGDTYVDGVDKNKVKNTTEVGNKVILEESNLVALNVAFTPESVSKLKLQILDKDSKLAEGVPIYLFLNTPGGSVVAGNGLFELIDGLDREVITVTQFAASMGFHTVQACGKRYITKTGVLMSHRARGGSSGQIPGELNQRVRFWTHYVNNMAKRSAKRIGITPKKYHYKHINEWWLTGNYAVDYNTADKVVSVKCGKTVNGTYTKDIRTFFGTYRATFHKCPLVSEPISVKRVRGTSTLGVKDRARVDGEKALMMMLYDRARYLREYVVPGKSTPFM